MSYDDGAGIGRTRQRRTDTDRSGHWPPRFPLPGPVVGPGSFALDRTVARVYLGDMAMTHHTQRRSPPGEPETILAGHRGAVGGNADRIPLVPGSERQRCRGMTRDRRAVGPWLDMTMTGYRWSTGAGDAGNGLASRPACEVARDRLSPAVMPALLGAGFPDVAQPGRACLVPASPRFKSSRPDQKQDPCPAEPDSGIISRGQCFASIAQPVEQLICAKTILTFTGRKCSNKPKHKTNQNHTPQNGTKSAISVSRFWFCVGFASPDPKVGNLPVALGTATTTNNVFSRTRLHGAAWDALVFLKGKR